MRNEIDYIAFVLAYDLLHEDFVRSDYNECDVVYRECLELAKDFLESEFNNPNYDLYYCLERYADYLRERDACAEEDEWETEMRTYMLDDEDEEAEDEIENENQECETTPMFGGMGWGVMFNNSSPEELKRDIQNFKTFIHETGLDKIFSVNNTEGV